MIKITRRVKVYANMTWSINDPMEWNCPLSCWLWLLAFIIASNANNSQSYISVITTCILVVSCECTCHCYTNVIECKETIMKETQKDMPQFPYSFAMVALWCQPSLVSTSWELGEKLKKKRKKGKEKHFGKIKKEAKFLFQKMLRETNCWLFL